jgi:hypothetical protein
MKYFFDSAGIFYGVVHLHLSHFPGG